MKTEYAEKGGCLQRDSFKFCPVYVNMFCVNLFLRKDVCVDFFKYFLYAVCKTIKKSPLN